MALIRTIGTTSRDRYAASCAISGICRVTNDASADGLAGDEPPGRWLQRQRKAAGLTQEDLAERSGLSVRTVRNLERGAPKPHPRSLHLLGAALNVPEPGISELIATYRAG